MAIEIEKVAFEQEKVAFELSLSDLKINAPTKEKALALFDNFEYKRAFSRLDIIRICNSAPSSAGKMIKKLKEVGLIEAAVGLGRGKYKFMEPKTQSNSSDDP